MRTPEQIEELLDKLEGMLNAYSDADAKYLDDQDKANWSDKYGERLGKYSDKLKVLNGDDFDILEESRKEHKDSYSDLTDDDYVNSLEENIKKVLARVWPEATPEETQEAAAEVANEVTEGETEAEPETETVETEPETETTVPEEEESLSDENAKKRYQKRSESNKKKLEGWNPQNRLTLSDEDAKEEAKDPVKEEYEELLRYKESMPKRGE